MRDRDDMTSEIEPDARAPADSRDEFLLAALGVALLLGDDDRD